jgi:ubiquinone/menaquinone biosynthesis C-methylase UbiE
LPDVQRAFYNRLYAAGPAAGSSGLHQLIAPFEVHRSDLIATLVEDGGHLLDVGSGDGTLLARCGPRFSRLTGVDIADVRVCAAARHLSSLGVDNVSFVLANVDAGLPLQSATVDVATITAVLGFIFDPLAMLDELHRVLRPGAQLVLEVLNLAFLPRRLVLLLGRLPRHSTAEGWDGGHLHNFTQAALDEALVARGFRVERWTGSGVFASLRNWWPSLLTGNLIAVCRRV